jgi:glycosyltransferase involved in cell wall biosynthesis
MRILIPITKFGRAGGYRVLSILANEFIRKGHQVDFLVSVYSELPYYPTGANIFWADAKGRLQTGPDKVSRGAMPFLALFNGLRTLKKKNYDVILANASLNTWPIHYSGIGGRVFYYIQAYEPEYFQSMGGLKNKLLAYLSRRSYALPFLKIVNAPVYCNYKEIKANHVVLPGLDLSLFYPGERLRDKEKRIWKIGTIGRIEPYKGTQFVLDAFKTIRETRKDVQLHMAFGEEGLNKEQEGIFIVQPHGDKNLVDFYRGLDMYISAGTVQHGAVHYPVIEAMACGVPVVTTPYYPAYEDNAWLIEPGNFSDIVTRILKVISDQEAVNLKLDMARKDVQQFDWDVVSEKMLEIFLKNSV